MSRVAIVTGAATGSEYRPAYPSTFQSYIYGSTMNRIIKCSSLVDSSCSSWLSKVPSNKRQWVEELLRAWPSKTTRWSSPTGTRLRAKRCQTRSTPTFTRWTSPRGLISTTHSTRLLTSMAASTLVRILVILRPSMIDVPRAGRACNSCRACINAQNGARSHTSG